MLTTDQLTSLLFTNVNTAQHRLTKLYQLRLVDRFQPLSGRYTLGPYHYVLDELGAMILTAERDDEADLAKVSWRTEQALAIGRSQRLAHQLGVSDFFVSLAAASRRYREQMALAHWWSESRCKASFGALVQPDGFGEWHQDGGGVRFYLEYDRSTEPLGRLAAKLPGYEDMEIASAEALWVLFTSAQRAAKPAPAPPWRMPPSRSRPPPQGRHSRPTTPCGPRSAATGPASG